MVDAALRTNTAHSTQDDSATHIDVDAVENKLKTLMSDIPAPAADAAQKEVITVPDNEEPIVSIYTDPEMQGSRVQVFVKRPAVPEQYNNLVYGEMLDVVQAYMTTG